MEGSGDDNDNVNDNVNDNEDEASIERATSQALTENDNDEEKSTTETSIKTTLIDFDTTTSDLTEHPTTAVSTDATTVIVESGDGSKEDAGEFEPEETVDEGTVVCVGTIGCIGVEFDRESVEKCRKCERSGRWRTRHASFCSECQTREEEKLKKKCEKCSRKGFAFRNIDFCENTCAGEDTLEKLKEEGTTTAMKEMVTEEMTSVTTEKVAEVESPTMMSPTGEDVDGEKKVRKGGEVRLQNRCKRCQRKGFYRRNTAFCDDTCHTIQEEGVDPSDRKEPVRPRNNENRKNNKKKIGSESDEKLKNKLGPLEDLIRYLIQKNHGA